MINTIVDKITTYILIFSVIAHLKQTTEASKMGEPTTLWVSFFILDFSSAWFRVYSIYLAGHRTEKVSNAIENLILPLY
jgi:hypothetical protein